NPLVDVISGSTTVRHIPRVRVDRADSNSTAAAGGHLPLCRKDPGLDKLRRRRASPQRTHSNHKAREWRNRALTEKQQREGGTEYTSDPKPPIRPRRAAAPISAPR